MSMIACFRNGVSCSASFVGITPAVTVCFVLAAVKRKREKLHVQTIIFVLYLSSIQEIPLIFFVFLISHLK